MKVLKNLLYVTAVMMAAVAFTSCSDDDDDLPNVNFSFDYSGATVVDGSMYVVHGETLEIEGLSVTPVNPRHQASIGKAVYYWDYEWLFSSVVPPFGLNIDTDRVPVGTHLLQIKCTVLETGCSMATATVSYKVNVVASTDDIPLPQNPGQEGPQPRIDISR